MKKTNLIRTTVVALSLIATLSMISLEAAGQVREGQLSSSLLKVDQGNSLEGTWQSVITLKDCQTGLPAPFSFRALTTFMRGGTMSEDALDLASPYRTNGHGIWKRVTAQQYAATWLLYTFTPDGHFSGTIRVRVNKTLSGDFNSLTGDGKAEIYNPAGVLVFTGCSDEVATRLEF